MRNKTELSFEIGVVYRKNGRLHLAVNHKTLITYRNETFSEVRPYQRYDVVRGISVEELCKQWGLELDELDRATAVYLTPSTEGLKTRPRGSRRRRAADQDAWRQLRTIRLVS
jgi:hypothetical protein